MADTQLYLSVGMPTIAILIGILVNVFQFGHLSASISARIGSVEARLGSVETRLDMVISKLMELDSRLTRVEERLENRR